MTKVMRTIRVDEADWDVWRGSAEADGFTVSEWIRRKLNEGRSNLTQGVQRESSVSATERGVVAAERSAAVAERVAIEADELSDEAIIKKLAQVQKDRKTCAHGRPKGYNCWQCGGLAKVG